MDGTKHSGMLLTAKTLGQMLSLSKRQVHRLNQLGKIPAPLRIGGAVRWSAEEVSAWLAAGAPDRAKWQAMRRSSVQTEFQGTGPAEKSRHATSPVEDQQS